MFRKTELQLSSEYNTINDKLFIMSGNIKEYIVSSVIPEPDPDPRI